MVQLAHFQCRSSELWGWASAKPGRVCLHLETWRGVLGEPWNTLRHHHGAVPVRKVWAMVPVLLVWSVIKDKGRN